MSARSNALPPCEPNVTPMLDVLLVLLIIFMAASMRTHKTIDANLPVPCPGICNESRPIVLEVLPGPSYRINTVAVTSAELPQRLFEIYSVRPEKIIQVAGHPNVRYADVVTAMDVAKSAGVAVVGVTLEQAVTR